MDTEDESSTYLKFLNDGPNNYLLHSSEDGLTDEFSVEPIFTEIEASDWSSEGFPILLSGPLVADEVIDKNVELMDKSQDNQNEDPSNETVTFFSTIDGQKNQSNGLLLSNDVLLQIKNDNCPQNDILQNNTVTHVINGNTYSITYTPSNEIVESVEKTDDVLEEGDNEVIQLLNMDGTVASINKNVFSFLTQKSVKLQENDKKIEDFFTEVCANKCKLCSYLCETIDEIKLHLKTKHDKEIGCSNRKISDEDLVGTKMTSILNNVGAKKKITMFLCSECGSGYSNKEDLKQHMISQHNLTYISTKSDKIKQMDEKSGTPEKNKPSGQVLATNLLKKQQNAMKKVKCSIKGCVLRFARDELRKKHEECHVNQEKRQFQCPVCKEKFSIWRICSMHLWKSHSIDLGLLTCPMCNQFKSNSPIRVVTHMAIHNDERPFVCSFCGKGFKQVTQLRNHEVFHKSSDNVPNWFTEKQCEFCDRHFANSKCLKKHIASVHDKFKPFICNICGHKTARKAMLQLHYRQHTGDKPHKCSYCDYKTGDHNCLRKHIMRHFGEAKYSCSYCDYQAIQSSAFKIHMTSKHPGKKGTYCCNICPYSSVNEASYLSHVKCHEIENKNNDNVDRINNKLLNGENDQKLNGNKHVIIDDDETQNYLNNEQTEDPIDTGGITIPA